MTNPSGNKSPHRASRRPAKAGATRDTVTGRFLFSGGESTSLPSMAASIIEGTEVAERFDMTSAALAATLGLGRDALTRKDRADARKSQQRLREVLEIIALARDWAGGDSAAMSWYRATPIPAFGGRTAEAIVKDGNAHLVREYLDHLALGGYA